VRKEYNSCTSYLLKLHFFAGPFCLITTILLVTSVLVLVTIGYFNFVTADSSNAHIGKLPTVNDPDLRVEVVSGGLESPTGMVFLADKDILFIEKNNGNVRRLLNGIVLNEPVLDASVANKHERGMLGIALKNNYNKEGSNYVFLFYSESKGKDGSD
jgi:glucose/arabinose dehydrogenase